MRRTTLLWTLFPLGAALAVAAGAGGCSPEERDFNAGAGAAGGGTSCEPGVEVPCYEGPEGTEDVGLCQGGTTRCNEAGDGYGACEGQVLPQAEACATADDEDCDGAADPCPLTYLWGSAPGVVEDNNVATAVAAGGDGSVIVAGELDGTIDFGQGPLTSAGSNDAFVAKLDAATGALRWAKRFGDDQNQIATSVAGDAAGNAYVAMRFSGTVNLGGSFIYSGTDDALVAKLDPGGSPIWAIPLAGGAGSQEVTAVAATPEGDVLVAGTFSESMVAGPYILGASVNGRDVFALRLDTNGSVIWATVAASGTYPDVSAVALGPDGSLLVAGGYDGTLALGNLSATSVAQQDAYIFKLDGAAGAPLWLQGFGGDGEDHATGVAVDSAGAIVVAGTFSQQATFGGETLITPSEESFFLARLDAAGAVTAARQLGAGFGGTDRMSAAFDSQDNLVLAGYFGGTLTFGGDTFTGAGAGFGMVDGFVAKLDRTGAHIASRQIGNDQIQIFSSVAVDAADRIFAAGATLGPLDLGGGPIGPADVAVATPIIGAYSP